MTEQAENKALEVDCDAGCKQPFPLPPLKTEPLPNLSNLPPRIEKHFFFCPHCNHEYIAYYTDPEIRSMQEQAQKIRARIESRHGNYDRGKLAGQYNRLKRQIGARMRQLRWKVEVGANHGQA